MPKRLVRWVQASSVSLGLLLGIVSRIAEDPREKAPPLSVRARHYDSILHSIDEFRIDEN